MTRTRLSIPLALVLLLASCSGLLQPTPVPTTTSIPSPIPPQPMITGRVIDIDGNPLPGASVASQNSNTTSDPDGWFKLPSAGVPEWITVKSIGYISRVRAAAPGIPILYRLSPDDGKTIVIQFGGDSMFGRRFFDPNEDGDTSDGLLPPDPDVDAHLKLLEPIRPLLGKSDLTVLNLESPITDQPYFSPRDPRPVVYHTTKDFVFSSDTSAVKALKELGVDAVDLGNNHLYDLLETGVQSTVSALDTEKMAHFGAGENEASAWAPAIIEAKDQKIALIGCTSIRQPIPPITDHDIIYVASDALRKGGAASCEESTLRSAVSRAKQNGNIVVVMIHGGFEYVRSPSNNIARLTMAARAAGATLVINHHPHVIGGFSWDNQSLVAWSMGNFIFDQILWPTFETYLLTVYLRDGKIIRAYADPLMLENYIPHGLTGEQAEYVVREAAAVDGPFVMENGVLEVDVDQRAVQKMDLRKMDGGLEPGQILTIPPPQWISGFQGSGNLLLGRDLLWVGNFENRAVNGPSNGAPLWDLAKDSVLAGQDYAYEGKTGIRLTRSGSNLNDAVTSPLHRILVNPGANLSITGMLRASQGAVSLLQISWYSDTQGPSHAQTNQPVSAGSQDEWQAFRFDVQVPSDAVAMNIFLRLTPPTQGIVTADFDDLRIIEWADPAARYSPLYDYARLTGSGEVSFTQNFLPGGEAWSANLSAGQNK